MDDASDTKSAIAAVQAPLSHQAKNGRRSRKRSVTGILLTGLLSFSLLLGACYLRGTSAVSKMDDPATPEQGALTKIVMSDDGNREIRTAVVIPVAIEQAWEMLSGDEWQKLFESVRQKEQAGPLEQNRRHVIADVMTPLGTITLDMIVTMEELPGGGYQAWWDAPADDLIIKKGNIRITPQGPGQTLFVYTAQRKYRQYPEFLVNNMLLNHQSDVVNTVQKRMIAAAGDAPQ